MTLRPSLKHCPLTDPASEQALSFPDHPSPHQTSLTKMKFLPAFLACLVSLALSAPSVDIDLDPEDNDTLEQFEKKFHQPESTDPVEKAKREEALKKNEALVKKENKLYLEHKTKYHSAINENSDLTEDELKKEKTGAKIPETRYGRGLIMPTGEAVRKEG